MSDYFTRVVPDTALCPRCMGSGHIGDMVCPRCLGAGIIG